MCIRDRGCGALKFLSKDHGEFKSIRVHDNFRNKGNGIKIIKHLINESKNLNIQEKGLGHLSNVRLLLTKRHQQVNSRY